jgi:uncharacterized MAPEG superfamily protein
MQPLSFELRWLIYTALLLLIMWMPYILAEIGRNGLVKALSYPDKREMPVWAERWRRAHYNLVENFGPFAVVVLAGEFVGVHTPTTRALVVIFFLARLVHPFAQVGRIWGTRTVSFAVGWAVTVIYLFIVLTSGH